MKPLLLILAASVAISVLALAYLISENPFEFADPGCDSPAIGGWLDVVRHGCLDPAYLLQFIGIYSLILFVCGAAILGAFRLLTRRRP